MTLGKAIDIFVIKYKVALNNTLIKKPISWALYETWKEVDKKEKEREE